MTFPVFLPALFLVAAAVPLTPILTIPSPPHLTDIQFLNFSTQKHPFIALNDTIYKPLTNGSYELMLSVHGSFHCPFHPVSGSPNVFAVVRTGSIPHLIAYDVLGKAPTTPLYNVTLPSADIVVSLDGSLVLAAVVRNNQPGKVVILDGKTGGEIEHFFVSTCVTDTKSQRPCKIAFPKRMKSNIYLVIAENIDPSFPTQHVDIFDIRSGTLIHRTNSDLLTVEPLHVFFNGLNRTFNQSRWYFDIAKNSSVLIPLDQYAGEADFNPEKGYVSLAVYPDRTPEVRAYVRKYDVKTQKVGPETVVGADSEPRMIMGIGEPYVATWKNRKALVYNLKTKQEIELDVPNGQASWFYIDEGTGETLLGVKNKPFYIYRLPSGF